LSVPHGHKTVLHDERAGQVGLKAWLGQPFKPTAHQGLRVIVQGIRVDSRYSRLKTQGLQLSPWLKARFLIFILHFFM
jgi:hypothetical protein